MSVCFFTEDWSDLFFFFFFLGGGGGSCGPMKKSAQVLSTAENGGPMTTYNDLSNIKFHRSFWLMFFFQVGEADWEWEHVPLQEQKHYENSCFAVYTCNAFWVQVPDFSLETIDCSMWLTRVFTKQSSRQIPESGVWVNLPTVGLSKTVYHCVMKTTKQQLTYKLFQHIVIP